MKVRIFSKYIICGLFFLTIQVFFVGCSGFSKKLSPEGNFADVGDHKLHYLKKGCGAPTVVFESGAGPDGHLPWFKVQNEIAKYTTTISYDRAGLLWSERGDNPKSCDKIAEELYILLKKSGCEKPFIIVGHSLSGLFLRTFFQKASDDIYGMILLDPTHPRMFIDYKPNSIIENPPDWLLKFAVFTGIVHFFNETYPDTNEDDFINLQDDISLSYKSLSAYFEERRAYSEMSREAQRVDSLGNIPLVLISSDRQKLFEKINDKKKLDINKRVLKEMDEDILSLSTNSKQIIAVNSGHYIQLEASELATEVIREMIEESNTKSTDH
jgi:pimeloyl-ACP methyl ester carboxylesterase